MFKQFDIVRLKTTKRVTWKSSPPNSNIDPNGNWSMIGSIGTELILCKEGSIIRIPFEDVEKIADYNIIRLFKENKDGKEREQGKEREERKEE